MHYSEQYDMTVGFNIRLNTLLVTLETIYPANHLIGATTNLSNQSLAWYRTSKRNVTTTK